MSALYDMGFVVRVPSWHLLETTVFDEYPGREEAFVAAGHDFDVREVEAGSEGGLVDPATYTGAMCRTPDGEWRAYARSPKEKTLKIRQFRDGAAGPLHGKIIKTVNKSYEPVQNSVPWDVLDAVLADEALNKSLRLNYETGGVLEGGAGCFVTAWLDHPFQVPGDDSPVYPYLFATWRHDGQGGINFGRTSVRIVCVNTRGAAEGEAANSGHFISLRHTKNVLEKIEDVKMSLQGIVVAHEEFSELATELAAIEVTDEQREEFVQRFIPYPASLLVAEGEVSKRQVTNIENARAAVRGTFSSTTIPEAHANTGWGLYNAATEYLDHLRPGRGGSDPTTNVQSYVKRTINPNRAKDAIVPLIRDVAGVA